MSHGRPPNFDRSIGSLGGSGDVIDLPCVGRFGRIRVRQVRQDGGELEIN